MRSSSEGSAYPRLDPASDPAISAVCRDVDDAQRSWALMAPLLAGRPRVRESRSNGHSYLRRWERPLTARLPAVPAAVPIYSAAGDTRVLVVDLDASRGGVEAVRRDAAAVRELVRAAGGAGHHAMRALAAACTCTCRSPQPIGFHEARDLALALAARTPTMDPSPEPEPHRRADPPTRIGPPHRGPPGPARHPHRRPPARRPPATHPRCSPRSRGLLAAELAALHAREHQPPEPVDAGPGDLPRRSGARELAADYLRIASTGVYDTTRYRSPSEARQAVLDAAVWAGLTLPAGAGPDRERHLARAGVLLHPVPAPRNPPQGPARRLAQGPRLRHRRSRPENPRRALSVTPPQASHHHTGGHHRTRSRSTTSPGNAGRIPMDPHLVVRARPARTRPVRPTGPASGNAGCCAPWARPR